MVKLSLIPIATVPKLTIAEYSYFSSLKNKIGFTDDC